MSWISKETSIELGVFIYSTWENSVKPKKQKD